MAHRLPLCRLPLRRRPLIQAAALAPWIGLRGALAQPAEAPMQQAAVGRVERWSDFRSRHVVTRHVEVWLPPDYDQKVRDGLRFGVLYMHDGQGLFDATTTWNRQAWAADGAAMAAMQAIAGQPFIIVGPWNAGALRHSEYFPAGFLPHLPAPLRERYVKEALKGESRSDAYLRFLVEELKPAVDARYATRPGRDATWLMGSSMGGLISAYGLWQYPKVFSAAGCLSTHWIATKAHNEEFPAAAIAYLQTQPPRPESIRLWTDRGTRELDAEYVGAHERVSAALKGLGFVAPRFHAEVIDGAGHNEVDWSRRAARVMRFITATEGGTPSFAGR